MADSKTFYITTTLPYVNAEPHVGFATELIRADVIARYKKFLGYEVFFNTGTDEHGQKLFEGAQKEGKDIQAYVDNYSEKFRSLKELLLISEDIHFTRTTDPKHVKAAQVFWELCNKAGYIYKKNYQAKYCVGCELEKTDSELVNGRCPLHPDREIQLVDEENYFFAFSKFEDKLKQLYTTNPNLVIPESRFGEIKSFVKHGLKDFSISRVKNKMSWGVDVPGDDKHVMYVWFDALVSYISTLGWPDNKDDFQKFWVLGTPVQYCGKDNLRQQSAMWQAMLMAAGLPNSDKIIIDGFITGDSGVKMSKSLGNTVNPFDLVKEYGGDALRYFAVRELNPFEDSPFTMSRFKDAYNANLANGLGNLVSRVMKMAEMNLSMPIDETDEIFPEDFKSTIEKFEINKAADFVWAEIGRLDLMIQEKEPFKLIKTDKKGGENIIIELLARLYGIAVMLNPIMPETSEKIKKLIKTNKSPIDPSFY